MSLPQITMSKLMDAGVHFGHQAHRWDPKMAPYIYGVRSGIHIIDLSKTVPRLRRALLEVRNVVASGGRILFVGTKKHAEHIISDSALRCAQYFMNHRWLGGTLTNWTTISRSIKRLRDLDELLEKSDQSGLTKKELLKLAYERDKLDKALGGIRNMGERPNLLFVIDTNREAIAVREARCLGIPVVAVTDSDCDPDEVDFPIPGNDDAQRSIALYCELVADAVLDGLAAANPTDPGSSENPTIPEAKTDNNPSTTARNDTSTTTDQPVEPDTKSSAKQTDASEPDTEKSS